MRRFWYAKYALTLLASTAITFHLLYSSPAAKTDKLGEDLETSQYSPNAKTDELIVDILSPISHAVTKLKTLPKDVETPTIHAFAKPKLFSVDVRARKLSPNAKLYKLGTNVETPTSHRAFTKSTSYLRRRLSQGSNQQSGWIVLPGNVTVHVGDRLVPPLNVKYVSNAENVCVDVDAAKKTLLIFVASSVDHFEQRKVIRNTWGLKLLQIAYNYRIVYLLGKRKDPGTQAKVEKESYRYGDLIQIDLEESFRNLGRKSVAGLQWSKTFCGKADFVMKTDDDILVHVPNLIVALADANQTDPLLMCHENRMRKILRKELLDKTELPESYHKYEVSPNELPGLFYPPYCSGMAYVFSRSVRDRLLEASASTPVFFIEDVYLTGFCRHKAGIGIRPNAGITLRPPVLARQASCSFGDGRITSQEVTGEELRQLWTELNTQGFFCPELLGLRQKQGRRNEISSP